jgi:hypothetical protein
MCFPCPSSASKPAIVTLLKHGCARSMRDSEAFSRSLPLKRRFHDRNERRRYEITLVTAAELIDDPATTLKNGLAYMERHMSAAA